MLFIAHGAKSDLVKPQNWVENALIEPKTGLLLYRKFGAFAMTPTKNMGDRAGLFKLARLVRQIPLKNIKPAWQI